MTMGEKLPGQNGSQSLAEMHAAKWNNLIMMVQEAATETPNVVTAEAADTPSSLPDASLSTPEQSLPTLARVKYSPDKDENTPSGIEYSKEGDVIGEDLLDKPAILTTKEGRQLYLDLDKDYLCDLTASKQQGTLTGNHWELDPEDNPTVIPGQKWGLDVNGGPDDLVNKVEVEGELMSPDFGELGNVYHARGGSPFAGARDLINELKKQQAEKKRVTASASAHTPDDTVVLTAASSPTTQSLLVTPPSAATKKAKKAEGKMRHATKQLRELPLSASTRLVLATGKLFGGLIDKLQKLRNPDREKKLSRTQKIAAGLILTPMAIATVGAVVELVDRKLLGGSVTYHIIHRPPAHGHTQLEQLMSVLPSSKHIPALHTLHEPPIRSIGDVMQHKHATATAAAHSAAPLPKINKVQWDTTTFTSYDIPKPHETTKSAAKVVAELNSNSPASLYEHHYGLHHGYMRMVHDTHPAIINGDLARIYPNPHNPDLYYLEVTSKGAKKLGKAMLNGSTQTADILRVAATA